MREIWCGVVWCVVWCGVVWCDVWRVACGVWRVECGVCGGWLKGMVKNRDVRLVQVELFHGDGASLGMGKGRTINHELRRVARTHFLGPLGFEFGAFGFSRFLLDDNGGTRPMNCNQGNTLRVVLGQEQKKIGFLLSRRAIYRLAVIQRRLLTLSAEFCLNFRSRTLIIPAATTNKSSYFFLV